MLLVAGGCISSDDANTAGQADNQAATNTAEVSASSTSTSEPSTTASTTSDSTDEQVTSTTEVSTTQTSTTEPSTSATPTTEPSTSAAASGERDTPVNQAEQGLRFDYGGVVGFERVDGVDWIWFDRYSFADSQGTELSEEPRWEMATDWHGGANVNPRLRSYPLAPDARILEIDPGDYEAACADLDLPWEFIDSDVVALLENGTGSLASLTFNDELQVVLIRDQRGC